jgi:hypothetical protein
MKNTSLILPLIFASFLVQFTACKEVPPFIDFSPEIKDTSLTDTNYVLATVPQQMPRKVLLEDFTGVRCVNCPAAQAKAKQISDANPGRIVLIALHATNFADPYPESKANYRTAEADNIYDMLGKAPGLPIGGVDRNLFAGETRILVPYNKWESYTNQKLAVASPLNLQIDKEFSEQNRELQVKITVTYTEDIQEQNYLSVALLESKIIDYQLTPTGKVPDYEHNHALRKMLTPYNGTQLKAQLQKGRVFVKEYKFVLPQEWNAENIEIAAFVHERINTFEVLQAEQVKLK